MQISLKCLNKNRKNKKNWRGKADSVMLKRSKTVSIEYTSLFQTIMLISVNSTEFSVVLRPSVLNTFLITQFMSWYSMQFTGGILWACSNSKA